MVVTSTQGVEEGIRASCRKLSEEEGQHCERIVVDRDAGWLKIDTK